MHAMKPATHRPSRKVFHVVAAAALAWASPGYCAPALSVWSWMDLQSDAGVDMLLMLLTALFWVVTHVWTLLVVWAEARATRAARASHAVQGAPDAEG
ncbi:hypothetical protein [Variovorax boronicumulans]|uniref:hypothetical protein n=1 Tax=Variovorax boronicumulans TaxID=436515 RepID=UPI00339A3B98